MEEFSTTRRVGKTPALSDAVQESSCSRNSIGSFSVANSCYCGLSCPVQTSWTMKNQERRFLSCPCRRGEGRCAFFKWVDPMMPDHAKEVIVQLQDQFGNSLYSTAKAPLTVDEVADKRSELVDELKIMREELVFMRKSVKAKRRKKMLIVYWLIVSWSLFIVISIGINMVIVDCKSKDNIGTRVSRLH